MSEPTMTAQKVWKYSVPLENGAEQVLEMPWDAQMLTVQVQAGVPCLWALVTPDAPNVKWHVHWVGTGHDVPEDVSFTDGDKYIGTVQLGAFVFHLFQTGYEEQDRRDW